MIIYEIIGWIGTGLILLAFFLLINDYIEEDDRSYLIMNLLGAIGVGVNVFINGAWPAFGLQVIWGLIAIYSLIKHNYRP